MKRQIPLLQILILWVGLVVGFLGNGCNEKESSPTTPPPISPSVSNPTWGSWQRVPGLEEGSLESLTWKDEDLYALNDSGVFLWKDAERLFELLSDNKTLHNFGLEINPSPTAVPPLTSLVADPSTDALFVLVDETVFRREGETWRQTDRRGLSLLEAEGELYLRRRGAIERSVDGLSWTVLTTIPSEAPSSVCCEGGLTFDPMHRRLYLYNSAGVFSFDLATTTWHALDPGDDISSGPQITPRTLFVDPSNGFLYAGTIFDLYASEDGTHWSAPLFYEETGVWGTRIDSITSDPGSGTLFVATERGIYTRSGTGPWQSLPNLGLTPSQICFQNGILWAATTSGLRSYHPTSGWAQYPSKGMSTKTIVAMKVENGTLFAQSDEVFSELPPGDDVPRLSFAVYENVAPGVWQLEKRAEGLQRPAPPSLDSNLGLMVFTSIDIPSLELEFLATPQGILVLSNGVPQRSWNEGLPTYRITAFAFDPSTQTLYVGTIGHGIYRLEL